MERKPQNETALDRLERKMIERQLRRKEMEDINQGHHVRKTTTREYFDMNIALNPMG